MKKHLIFCLLTMLSFSGKLFSQIKIGNNPTTIGSGSLLELESTTKGFVLPRMTGAQMNAIASPVAGMFIYNTDSSCICQYMGSAWRSLCGGNIGTPYNDWHILGNAGTIDVTNFLGTTDNIPLSFKVNNQKAGRIDHLLNNSFFGYQSGNSITTGTGNSFFGQQSGFSNTTASNNFIAGYQAGYNNTISNNHFIGYQSGYSNTTGNFNHFEGYQSGYSNTTGQYNMAMGYQSMYTNTTGGFNVGIGYQTLNQNTTGGSNVAVGWAALNKNTTGGNNVAVGGNALFANTTGINNTALGNNALSANTTGINNTSIGVVTMQTNTTGSWNTALGGSTLNKNTTGNSNTAIGESTLPNNTTGNYNSGLGSQTLYNNTSGSNNTATGYQALYNNNTGSHNLADGYQTMRSNTTGSYNTAIGELAMFSDTSGNNNTAIGWASLFSNTNGSSNTAIGYGALYPNVIGANKTGVGYQAGFNDSLGNNNTWFGYQADQGVARISALTNATAIGYLAKANISNSLILGGTGANAVSVGIGTASPNTSSVLDITSTTKGVLPPRLTTAQMNAITVSAATNGMFVYNTDSSCYCLYNGTAWRSLCGGAINTKSITEWLDKDSLSGYTGAAMIYAKQALSSSQDTVAVFDDGSWYHADPGITQFSYGNSARNNNLFNSTKIPLASTGSNYNFSTFNNQIDNTSNAAGSAAGISSTTYLPTTTARTGITYGSNIQTVINGTAAHTGSVYAGSFQTSVYGSNNMAGASLFATQSLFADASAGASMGTVYAANNQFYKSGTGTITTAYGANNFGWLASNVGGTIGTLSGSMNQVGYPNSGVDNCTITTANAGQYYVGLGAVTGTGSFGTVNGAYIGLNLAATAGNVVPITNINGLNIDFQSQLPDARITNVYGIKMNDVTRGGTINYGIYTGLGKISFGDNTEIRSTGYLTIPSGTTAQRPGAPVVGMTRFNSTLGVTEEYGGSGWEQRMISSATAAAATTGAIAVTMTGMSVYTITPTGACTFNATGGVAGQYCTFYITTAGVASFALTWGTNFKTTAVLNTGVTAGKVFTITFICKDGTTWAETSRTVAM